MASGTRAPRDVTKGGMAASGAFAPSFSSGPRSRPGIGCQDMAASGAFVRAAAPSDLSKPVLFVPASDPPQTGGANDLSLGAPVEPTKSRPFF